MSRSRSATSPYGDLVFIRTCLNFDILGNTLTFVGNLRGIVSVSHREFAFWGWLSVSLWTPLCYFFILLICAPNPGVFCLSVGINSCLSPSASLEPSASGGQYLTGTSPNCACCTQGLFELDSLLSELHPNSTGVRHALAAVAAHPLKLALSRCTTS